jgi:superfamily II DNA or RNA helicase
MPIELYPYQKDALKSIRIGFQEHNSIMLQLPTGTGKTTVFSAFVKWHIKNSEPNKRVLIMVHRKELVEQIDKRLRRMGILPGIIMAGKEDNPSRQVQVASLMSLLRRKEWPQNISLIVVDEAHHIKSSSYLKIIDHYKPLKAKFLGVTATPSRLSGEGFSEVVENLVCGESIQWFIDQGYLSSFEHFGYETPNLSDVAIDRLTKDYNTADLFRVYGKKKHLANVVQSYKDHAQGKKALIFAVNRAHSKNLVERFEQEGIKAHYIDGDTPKQQREFIIESFKKGEFNVLCNVEVFTEGFDCPDIECVILARPTESLVLYLQMVGRALRQSENKDKAFILDCAGLWEKHGLVNRDRKWTLDGQIELVSNSSLVKSDSGRITEILPTEIEITLDRINHAGDISESVSSLKFGEINHQNYVGTYFFDPIDWLIIPYTDTNPRSVDFAIGQIKRRFKRIIDKKRSSGTSTLYMLNWSKKKNYFWKEKLEDPLHAVYGEKSEYLINEVTDSLLHLLENHNSDNSAKKSRIMNRREKHLASLVMEEIAHNFYHNFSNKTTNLRYDQIQILNEISENFGLEKYLNPADSNSYKWPKIQRIIHLALKRSTKETKQLFRLRTEYFEALEFLEESLLVKSSSDDMSIAELYQLLYDIPWRSSPKTYSYRVIDLLKLLGVFQPSSNRVELV